jgi:hypothetical protein
VGPRAVLDTVVKRKIPSPRRESKPRTPIVQSVASLDTVSLVNSARRFLRMERSVMKYLMMTVSEI